MPQTFTQMFIEEFSDLENDDALNNSEVITLIKKLLLYAETENRQDYRGPAAFRVLSEAVTVLISAENELKRLEKLNGTNADPLIPAKIRTVLLKAKAIL